MVYLPRVKERQDGSVVIEYMDYLALRKPTSKGGLTKPAGRDSFSRRQQSKKSVRRRVKTA